MGQRTWRFGSEPEQANAIKLACNLMLACAIEATGEGAALARAHGVPAADFIDLVTGTLFAGSPVYKGYGGMIAEERYSPAGFKLSLGLKDVRLAVEHDSSRTKSEQACPTMIMENTLGITSPARILGVSVKTLQRREREGRLRPAARTTTNRRHHTESQLRAALENKHVAGTPDTD